MDYHERSTPIFYIVTPHERLDVLRHSYLRTRAMELSRGKKEPETPAFIGMLGEFAVARVLGLDPCESFTIHEWSDGGVDLRHHHITISVKTRHNRFMRNGVEWDHAIISQRPNKDLMIKDVSRSDYFVATALGCGKDYKCQCEKIMDRDYEHPVPVKIYGARSTKDTIRMCSEGDFGQGTRWTINHDLLLPLSTLVENSVYHKAVIDLRK